MSALPLPPSDLQLVLDQTAPLWDEVRGQSLFITGGTGFFGCWLLESFCYINRVLNLHAHATVLTRNIEAFQRKCPHIAGDPAITCLAGDVRDFAFPAGAFQYIVHAATETVTESTFQARLDLLNTITQGTDRVLQFASTHGTRKLLLTSSGAVYGPQPSEISHLPETYLGGPDPLQPASAYGEGKRLSELLCALYGKHNDMECKIARCWAFCGPHLPLDQHFAIGNFIGDILSRRSIRITGDGTPRRSYLYAADLAAWLWTILFNAPPLTPINVGSSHDVSILQLAQTVAAVLDLDTEIRVSRSALPGAAPLRYVPSVDRARDLLSLSVTVDLRETINRTAAWYRAHRT